MQKKLNALSTMAAFSLVAVSAHADYTSTDTQTNITTPVVTTSKSQTEKKTIPSSTRPQVNEGVDLFLTADWLIWQANASGLGYVIEDKAPSATTIQNGHVKNPEFKYEFGFKVGLGCNLSHDGWDAYLNWTWLRDRASNSTSNESGENTLFTTFISPTVVSNTNVNGPSIAQNASSHWHLRLDVLDLEIGREFAAGKWLSLRPFFGLRSGWVRQKYHVDYDNVSNLFTPSTTSYSEYKVHMTNDYWGFGPRAGLNGYWGFGSGWSLYGNAGASILYGFFHLDHNEESIASSTTTVQKQARNSFHSSKVITDLELGVQWDYIFFNDTFHVALHAGWEHHMFFSQNQFMRFTNGVELGQFLQNQGDLAFQGWTIGARFDF